MRALRLLAAHGLPVERGGAAIDRLLLTLTRALQPGLLHLLRLHAPLHLALSRLLARKRLLLDEARLRPLAADVLTLKESAASIYIAPPRPCCLGLLGEGTALRFGRGAQAFARHGLL